MKHLDTCAHTVCRFILCNCLSCTHTHTHTHTQRAVVVLTWCCQSRWCETASPAPPRSACRQRRKPGTHPETAYHHLQRDTHTHNTHTHTHTHNTHTHLWNSSRKQPLCVCQKTGRCSSITLTIRRCRTIFSGSGLLAVCGVRIIQMNYSKFLFNKYLKKCKCFDI